MKNLILVAIPMVLCQCASLEKSIGLGVGIGAASGLTAAQMANYNAKGNIVLMLSGAAIGGAIGALLNKGDHEVAVPSSHPVSIFKNNSPPLKNAEKDVLWIPNRIDGDNFEEGHRVFVIKKPAHWQLREDDKSDTAEEEETTNE